MHVSIYFVGGDQLSLFTCYTSEEELQQLLDWFKDKNGSEVKTIKYNMNNGIVGEYMLNRKSIAYIKTEED
ncbi:MAG: hypothetical protein GXX10_05075 [Clostridiaceae bacterium]|nr:hypothetical protein [Clostridiaceae bacterium]